jgi:hypothetical protein
VIAQFQRSLGHSPVKLTQDEIRNHLLDLKRVHKLQVRTLNQRMYGIRAFCNFIQPDADTIIAPHARMTAPSICPKCNRGTMLVVSTIPKLDAPGACFAAEWRKTTAMPIAASG